MCEILDKYINRGIEKGIIAMVSTLKELGLAYEDTLKKIQEKFDLTEAQAKETMQNYW